MMFPATLAVVLLAVAPGDSPQPDIKVTLLGTSTPNPLPDRFGPSTLVEAGGERLLFDCGRGATIRLWQVGVPLGTVKVFLTHLHSDHTVGIPDLWLTGYLNQPYGGRQDPLRIWGPKGTAEMITNLREAYDADIQIRRASAGSPSAITDEQVGIVGEDFVEGTVYEKNGVRVSAFKVRHANIDDAFGFRVDYKGRSVVISGDMAPNENFIKHAKGADVVIHEVGVARPELLEKRPEMRHMLVTHHSSPEDAGRDFAQIGPKLAVYTHYSRLRSPEILPVEISEIIARTRTVYSGPLEAGEDLMSISIGDSVTVTRPGK